MRQTPAAVLRPPDPPGLPASDAASTPVPGLQPWVLRLTRGAGTGIRYPHPVPLPEGEGISKPGGHEPELLHIAELDEHLIPMAEQYFEALNGKASRRANVRVDVMDGRHVLKMSPDTYDVILSDAMMLASEDGLRLYTQEHFREARRHLRPGGVVLRTCRSSTGT
ncbi:MAG TPA: hypothetical protein VFZ09_30375 [Archangium sp.]|uniref:spermidine synthase n=1 Tax=Archangium sp. TaxID=1872627 RepID=UPI002E349483|nr:hypothetical protein [Archangium sp.]HEX5750573.1 hypothetical protein [Archangium sp.]